jgi:hypothetical protein
MFRCSRWGCPWTCGNHRNNPCLDRIIARTFAGVLWLVLAGSVIAGVLSLRMSSVAP